MPSTLNSPRTLAVGDVERLSDDELIAEQFALADERRRVDTRAAMVAAEIKRRSHRDLGYHGLAQRRGARTAEVLVQQVTGLSAADARTLVTVGAMVSDAPPWLAPVAGAVERGAIGVDAAHAIQAGLGEPDGRIAVADLLTAADDLVTQAPHVTFEQLARLARRTRDQLDQSGIALREEERRDRRYLNLTPLPDGMTRISGLLDPESAAIVVGAVDAVTAPRRGGPRFIEKGEPVPPAEDDRTIPQLMTDALVDLVRVATLADEGNVLGAQRVGVRVHVKETDLRQATGAASIEGQPDAVDIATAERLACDAGIVPVLFDRDGTRVMNVGRSQRSFTTRQRIALAARDGGCRFPGCDRPPTWTEAHHILEWSRGGRTDIDNGLLLCRHHHLLVHNNGWRIEREGRALWIHPPTRVGEVRERIAMPVKGGMPMSRA